MFSLTISFGPGPVMWTLMWRDKEKADAAFSKIRQEWESDILIGLIDDFGQHTSLRPSEIHGVMLEDMELSKQAHIERALHQARLQAKAQEMAESDQVLRAARARGGPAILTPGMPGNGMFPR